MSTLHTKTLRLVTCGKYYNGGDNDAVRNDWINGTEFARIDTSERVTILDHKDIKDEFNKIEVCYLDESGCNPYYSVLWEARVK